ncbi:MULTISPECIES: hypothetical protein [Dietzia]|jgi:hypothetical protein|uniref:Uncharacterized protein n=1 Tax=Dietzia maris TaxID=37915 RepID=A0ABT8GXC8_9ACTN|nr:MULTISPECIES: hypothetical protein [Dietzia]MBB0992173.1 hypothetical protein [Dietzia sp. SLG510A3-30A2]MBB0993563.1 hypothetical protein [Dietzia sp. SLG510A3-40A3]MBB1010671.1 hypothetical protein [Dietzia sp. SLG510A3-3B2-2]ODQ96754.1 hypothetical protein BFG51_12360 [Dietzia alimentaria]HBD21661.1 hypothetical protein [Dietzia sp.]
MSLGWGLTLVALLPLAAWGIALTVVAVRRWLRRRGDEPTRRLRLARLFGNADLAVVPTSDVDLPEHTVLEVASDAGMRLVGYERTDTPLRRRVGVFVRIGSELDAVIRDDRTPR